MKWLIAYAVTRVAWFCLLPRCAEDAYITFRAARNLLWYGAPTFNPGEPSWPASSPLWVGWMFPGIAMGVDVDAWAHLGSLIAEVLLLVAVRRLIDLRAAIAFGIMLAFYQCAIAISLSGIEMFAMVSAFAWALTGNKTALAILACSRPEGVILAAVAGWPWRKKWLPLAAGACVWVIMMLGTGRLMPAGVSAKVGTYGLHALAGTRWFSLFMPWGGLEAQAMGFLGAISLLLCWAWRLNGPARIFAVSGGVLLLAYILTGAVYFFWYMTLPICAAMLCVASIPNRMVYVVALLIAVSSWTNSYPARRWQFQYRQLIKVAMQLPDEGTVIMDAIGVTGWQRARTRFIDVIGLSSPISEEVRKSNQDGWLTHLIQEVKPEVVVVKLREITSNMPDAGAGRPFVVVDPESLETGIVGGLFWQKKKSTNPTDLDTLGSAVLGYRPTQLDQDVILTLYTPKPPKI